MNSQSHLESLYQQTSKHSNYQILHPLIGAKMKNIQLSTNSRYEKERLDYISRFVDFQNKSVLDIGANTGYFSLAAKEGGCSHVTVYEGNKTHAAFIKESFKVLSIEDVIEVHDTYYNFETKSENVDVTFLLNVLHHVGDDYGDTSVAKKEALKKIASQLRFMADICTTCIFQLGFCWKGDRNHLLFENGTKAEMIDFVKGAVKDRFKVAQIGIAEKQNGKIQYSDLSDENIQRQDALGEFLNRPLFILQRV